MKEFSLYDRLSLSEEVVKKSEKLEAELRKLKTEGRAKVDQEIRNMEEEVWLASEASRKADAVMSIDAGIKRREYVTLLEKKNTILQKHQRAVDGLRVQLEALLFQAKSDAMDLLDEQIRKVQERREVRYPLPRGQAYNSKIKDYERMSLDSGVIWLKVFMNVLVI